jgi:hypothetical protein
MQSKEDSDRKYSVFRFAWFSPWIKIKLQYKMVLNLSIYHRGWQPAKQTNGLRVQSTYRQDGGEGSTRRTKGTKGRSSPGIQLVSDLPRLHRHGRRRHHKLVVCGATFRQGAGAPSPRLLPSSPSLRQTLSLLARMRICSMRDEWEELQYLWIGNGGGGCNLSQFQSRRASPGTWSGLPVVGKGVDVLVGERVDFFLLLA